MSVKTEVRYTIRTADAGSHGCYSATMVAKTVAWLLLRDYQPHSVVTVETVAVCGACGGSGELVSVRSRKPCRSCKGRDSYQVISTEELTSESLREGMGQ